jgi:hypothetical protein
MGYEFTLDGTDSNALSHRLYAKPYFSKGPFAIRLNAFVETEAFASFPNSILPIPTGVIDLTNYIFTFIDHLRIGYETSPFYLVADSTRTMSSELSTFFAPNFTQDNRLVLQAKVSIGAFTIHASVDDLRLGSLKAGDSQFASLMVAYTKPKGYPFTMALGTLGKGEKGTPASIDLYPLLSFKLPIITSRTTQFSALIQAQGYLPAYPNFKPEELFDTGFETLFPNYLLASGISLSHGDFSARLMAALNHGENRNFLVNDFTYSDVDTTYSSDFDFLAELGWRGKSVSANLAVNLPLTSAFTFAKLTSGHGADFTQFSLSVDISGVTISLGVQQLGIIDTIKGLTNGSTEILDLLGGPYAASYLTIGYTWAPFTFTAKASYPASSTPFTMPVLSFAAKVDLNKRH